jgi:Helix-turn-helix domain
MRGQKTSLLVLLTSEERQELEHWLRSSTMTAGRVRRAHAVLLVSRGISLVETGRRIGMTERNVRKWIKRFLTQRIAGLDDLPRPGRRPSFSPRSGTAYRQNSL